MIQFTMMMLHGSLIDKIKIINDSIYNDDVRLKLDRQNKKNK